MSRVTPRGKVPPDPAARLRPARLLIKHRDRVVSKAELLDTIWPDVEVGETALTQAIAGLRRVLGGDGEGQSFIQTIRGRGYRFVPKIVEKRSERDEPLPSPSPRPLENSEHASGATMKRSFFIGRQPCLQTIALALAHAHEGRGRLLVLLGEPGIGKTRAAQEACRIASGEGFLCLVGHCRETEGAPPFWPWIEIVRSYVAAVGKEAAHLAMGRALSDIARLIPDIDEATGPLEAKPIGENAEERFRLFDGFARFLLRASLERPLMLLVDDVHWADEPSLALLEVVARELSEARILLVTTCRDTALTEENPPGRAVRRLLRDDPERRLALEGLTDAEIKAFVQCALGRSPSPELVATLLAKTAGNPLYLGELLRFGDVENRLAALASLGPSGRRAAAGLFEIIERHLGTLSSACRQMLEAASVLGVRVPVALLSKVCGLGFDEALGLAEEAMAARVVSDIEEEGDDAVLRFAHGLIRDVLYHRLRLVEQIRLHAAAATSLTAHYGSRAESHLDELAHHYRHAAPLLGMRPAVEHALRAARRAMQTAAYEQAVFHCEWAVESLSQAHFDHRLLLESLLQLGHALRVTGDNERARSTFERAAELARQPLHPEALADAALGFALDEETGAPAPARIALLEEALASPLPDAHPKRALLMSRLAIALYFTDEHERRQDLSQRALQSARTSGGEAELVYALRARHFTLWEPSFSRERLAISNEMRKLSERARDPEPMVFARIAHMQDLLDTGGLASIDDNLAALTRLADDLGSPTVSVAAAVYTTTRALLVGELDEAERSFAEASALQLRASNPLMGIWLAVQLWVLRREQGRLAEIEPFMRALIDAHPSLTSFRCGLAYTACAQSNLDEAREILEYHVGKDVRHLRRDGNWPVSVALLAEVSAILGDRPRASVLYEALAPLDGYRISIGLGVASCGPASRYLGLLAEALGDEARARAHLESAIRDLEIMGAGPLLAYARHELARILLRGSPQDRARAVELAALARQAAERIGMPDLLARLRTAPLRGEQA